ncbi:hypothetical protein CKM354_000700000 [Cercospora kikuchii]|uniref:2EXR domain-containing protein n=1 Tax=Cercospora kikuchii TaxID=84275 RepID=A0A9P3FDV7_9PEZI|nr:uncharacterized protein CKM354_000700000 [Cercospora kikuchii]GIZ43786.1 hypothetical protein CKM354_000700000 [Cercospora kikuchii]
MNRCRLLELPGELRNNIYEIALLQDEPIQIDLTRPSTSQTASSSIFSLLQTCKQIRSEARDLIYDNTFEFITAIHQSQEPINNNSLHRLRKICQTQSQSHQPSPKFRQIKICLDRSLPFENVAHHIGMLFRASEPLRELQKSGVNVAVYVSAQLCKGIDFSPKLEFHLRDVEEAKKELEEEFMRQRVEAGFGDGKDLKTVYFELLKMKLIEAFFSED